MAQPNPHEGQADVAAVGAAEGLSPATVERLFAEHNRALIRFLRTRLRSEAEARDVAQEAYVRLLQIDFEDPAPGKAEQFGRWRELRTLQCANPRSVRDYCRH